MARFFIEAGQYIETLTDVDPATRPSGSVAVSQRPSPDHQYQNGSWVYVAPVVDQSALRLMVSAEKWRVYRAMTQLRVDGQLRGQGDAGSWPTMRDAMFAANAEAQNEWNALAMVPRSEAKWAYLYQGVLSVKAGDVEATNAFLDAVFARAASY